MTTKKKIFCLGDGGVNNHGFRLLLSGGDLESFKQNPVMLNMHNDMQVIGQWVNIELKDDGVFAEPDFDLDDPIGKEVARKVDKGYIKMCSMGVIPLEFSDAPELKLPGQDLPTVTRWKLREGSIVPFGSNGRAMVQLYDSEGKAVNMADPGQIIKLMDSHGFKPNNSINTETTMKNVLKFLNLADNATEADALAAVTKLVADKSAAENKVTELSDKISQMERSKKDAQKQESETLIEAAVKDGRINADQKPAYVKLFDADFDSAKIALSALQPRNPITGQIETGKQTGAIELQELIKLSWTDLDKQDKLSRLKELSEEHYREKFKSQFGKYPS